MPGFIGRYRILCPLGEGGMGVVLLGVRAKVEHGYFCVARLERDAWLDPIRSHPDFQEALRLARERHLRAASVFVEEGGPGVPGVCAPALA